MSAATRLVGKAPLTLVRTLDRRVAYVYKGKPAPSNISAEERERLLKGQFLAEVAIVEDEGADAAADGAVPGGSGAGLKSGGAFDVSTLGEAGIDATMAWVNEAPDNAAQVKARAEQALAAEQAKPVDKQRGSLVPRLEKLLGPA